MSARKTSLCVLFSDVTDSTGLYEALGDEGGRRLVLECLELMTQVVEECHGTAIERLGDEVFATFPDAVSAGRASCELHRAIEAANAHRPATTTIRIGFHLGPLLIDGDQLFGDTVHIARRVASLAKAQQTLTTRQTTELIPAAEHLVTRFVDRTYLKGKTEPFELFEILWDEGAATVNAGETGPETNPGTSMERLILDCGEQTCTLDSLRRTVTIGRDPRADVVLDHPRVSRLHARVEHRKDKFVFVDQSTNGSQVIEPGGNRRFVRRDECILTGEGTIVFGPDDADADFPSLRYRLHIEE